ncbi:MAG: hypothetical protein QXS79_05140 [Candidatus Bathyarchaeia archaeon]
MPRKLSYLYLSSFRNYMRSRCLDGRGFEQAPSTLALPRKEEALKPSSNFDGWWCSWERL